MELCEAFGIPLAAVRHSVRYFMDVFTYLKLGALDHVLTFTIVLFLACMSITPLLIKHYFALAQRPSRRPVSSDLRRHRVIPNPKYD